MAVAGMAVAGMVAVVGMAVAGMAAVLDKVAVAGMVPAADTVVVEPAALVPGSAAAFLFPLPAVRRNHKTFCHPVPGRRNYRKMPFEYLLNMLKFLLTFIHRQGSVKLIDPDRVTARSKCEYNHSRKRENAQVQFLHKTTPFLSGPHEQCIGLHNINIMPLLSH